MPGCIGIATAPCVLPKVFSGKILKISCKFQFPEVLNCKNTAKRLY